MSSSRKGDAEKARYWRRAISEAARSVSCKGEASSRPLPRQLVKTPSRATLCRSGDRGLAFRVGRSRKCEEGVCFSTYL